MLVPGKMQHVICTGNLGSEQYDELRELAPNVHVVSGDFDLDSTFPETRVAQVGDFRIGVVHGHQIIPFGNQDALARMRRKLSVDILISGHTHQHEVTEYQGYYHINPVSTVRLIVVLVILNQTLKCYCDHAGINHRRLHEFDQDGDAIVCVVVYPRLKSGLLCV
jgi:putative phosphoesterase